MATRRTAIVATFVGGAIATAMVNRALGIEQKPADGLFNLIAVGSIGAGLALRSRTAPRIGAAALLGVYAQNGPSAYSRPGAKAMSIQLLAALPELSDGPFLRHLFNDDPSKTS